MLICKNLEKTYLFLKDKLSKTKQNVDVANILKQLFSGLKDASEANKLAKKLGYTYVVDLLNDIKKIPGLDKDFIEFVDVLARGYENVKIKNGQMYDAMKKGFAVSGYEKLLKEGKKSFSALKKKLQKYANELEAIRNSGKTEEEQLEDLIKLTKKYGFNLSLGETKYILKSINNYDELVKFAEKGKYLNIVDAKDSAIAAFYKIQGLEELADEGLVFVKKKTIQADKDRVSDIVKTGQIKNWDDLYNKSIKVYEDYLKKLNNIDKELLLSMEDIQKAIDQINDAHGYKWEIVGQVYGDIILIKDNATGYTFFLPVKQLNRIVEDYADLFKTMGDNFGKTTENAKSNVEAFEKIGTLTKEDIKKAFDKMGERFFAKITEEQKEVLNEIMENIWSVDKFLANKMIDELQQILMVSSTIKLVDRWLNMMNADFYEEYVPELAELIKKWSYWKNNIVRDYTIKYKDFFFKITNEHIDLYKQNKQGFITAEILRPKFEDTIGVVEIHDFQHLYNKANGDLYEFYKLLDKGYGISQHIDFKTFKDFFSDVGNILKQGEQQDIRGLIAYLDTEYGAFPGLNASNELFGKEFIRELAEDLANQIAEVKGYEKVDAGILENILTRMWYKHRNVNAFLLKLKTSLEYVNDYITQAYKEGGAYGNYFYRLLKQAGLEDNRIQKHINDLYGESLFKKWQWYAKLRGAAYWLQLNPLSIKGWGITLQNFLFGSVEGISRFGSDTPKLDELFEVLNEAAEGFRKAGYDLDEITKFVKEDISYIQATKYLEDNKAGLISKIANYINAALYKLTKKETQVGEKVSTFIQSPVAYADEFVSKMLVAKGVAEDVINKLGIDIDEIRFLLREGRFDDVARILKKIEEEVSYQHTSFFKMAEHAGLSRNNISNLPILNFFSGWGSKKFAEYVYHMFIKPLRKGRLVARITGDTKEGFKTAIQEFVLNDRSMAFAKQALLGAYLAYELGKFTDDINTKNAVLQTSILYQAAQAYFLTRGIMDGFDNFITTINEDKGVKSAMFMGIKGFVDAIQNNFLKDMQMFVGLGASLADIGLEEQYSYSKHGWKVFTNWLINATATPLMFSVYDNVRGYYTERLDSDEIGVIEFFFGGSLTNYKEKIDDMKKVLFIQQYTDNPYKALQGMFELNILPMVITKSKEFKVSEAYDILSKDVNYNILMENAELPENYYYDKDLQKKLYSIVTQSDLLDGWDWERGNKKTVLVLNELEQQGYDTKKLISFLKSGALKNKTETLLKLQAIGLTKAQSAALLSYAIQERYKELKTLNKKALGVKTLPEEIDLQIKGQLLQEYLPILAKLDRKAWADMVDIYIKNEYMQKDNPVRNFFIDKGNMVLKELQLKIFGELIELDEIDYQSDKFLSAPVLLTSHLDPDTRVEYINKMFNWIEDLNVSSATKTAVKVGILYNNFSFLRDIILSAPYKFSDAVSKLMDLIYDTADEVDFNLGAAEGLLGTNPKINFKIKYPDIKPRLEKVKDAVRKVRQLKSDIVRNPRYTSYTNRKLTKKLSVKFQKLNIKIPEREVKFKLYKPKQLKGDELKTRLKRIKAKKLRKPKIKITKTTGK